MSKFILEIHIVLKGDDPNLLENLDARIRRILDLYDDELDIEVGGGLKLESEVKNVQTPEPV